MHTWVRASELNTWAGWKPFGEKGGKPKMECTLPFEFSGVPMARIHALFD